MIVARRVVEQRIGSTGGAKGETFVVPGDPNYDPPRPYDMEVVMGYRMLVSCLFASAITVGCCKNKPDAASISHDRAFSRFALKIQQQIERETDPTATGVNDVNPQSLSHLVSSLRQRRAALQANLAKAKISADSQAVDSTRDRLAIIRIDRQLELVDRLLSRYEQNAPALASGQ